MIERTETPWPRDRSSHWTRSSDLEYDPVYVRTPLRFARRPDTRPAYFSVAFIVQGHRFDIFEDVGCYPAIVNTSLTYLLVTLWPIFIGLASLVFTLMNLSYTQRHRHSLDSWMECTPFTLLTSSLYIRLVVLGLIAFGLSSMTSVRELVSQITGNSVAWPGWAVVHADFGRVDQIPRGLWAARGTYSGFGVELRRWVSVWCALAAFLVLGTTREAGERYKAFGKMILRVIGGKGVRRDEESDVKRYVFRLNMWSGLLILSLEPAWKLSNPTTRTKKSYFQSSRNTKLDSLLHPQQLPTQASHPLLQSHARPP